MTLNIRNYNESNYIPRFQEGGQMVEEPPMEGAPMEGAPAEGQPMPEQGGGDPMQDLLMGAQEALQSQNCEVAMQVCQMLLELAQGGGGAEAAPAEAPVYKKGGKLSRTIRKDYY